MPTITKILEQKRRPNRRNVYLDGKFAFGCNVNIVAKFRLKEGMSVTKEQVDAILAGEVLQEALDYALKTLERRLHSREELRRKLAKREYTAQVIENVLNDLQRLGYVDDARFAKTKAMSAAQYKQHGHRRARVELMKAGVPDAVARKAIEDVYDPHDSLAVARTLAQKKASQLRKLDPVVARRRLAGMLGRRGFDYETIRPVIDEVLGYGDELHDS
jgi:regulatory protein